MRALRGCLVTPFTVIEHGQVEVEEGKITYVGNSRDCDGEIHDYGDAIVSPGFIDIHIHGLAGYDTMDPDREAVQHSSEKLASKGVTGFLATLQTAPHEEIIEALTRVKQTISSGVSGAKVLGSHLEGPYINVKRIGAQQEYVREPSMCELEEILSVAGDSLKLVTLAPEVKEGLEAVRYLRSHGIVVSAGHTDASYDEACQAFEAGVSLLSHFWNGMRELHHREPGVIGAGLMNESIRVELIADLLHVHPVILGLTVKYKGADNIALVSDSIKPAGLPDGEYRFGDRIFVMENGLIKLPSGVIAGSSICLNEAVKNMVEEVGVNLPKAVQMATDTPARILGLKKGRLEAGYDADLALLDRSFKVIETIVEGETVYKRSE